jgi:membrane-bound inhibitor of C-type lysozyme
MTPDRRKQLVAYQRGWIKGRDECWKANDQRICIRDNYAIRIFELRQGYADTRTKDDKGISTGPLSLECRDFGAGIGIVFISTDPQIATLAWKDRKMALAGTPSGSGANYAGHSFDGSYTLSTKGKEATFDTPDGRRYSCMIATGG